MKPIRGLALGLFAAGLAAFFSSAAFAEETANERKADLLKQAATVLKTSHPVISLKLTEFANEEKRAEKKKMQERRAEHIKLLRESATALESAHPKLAERLTKMADHMAKKMEEKKSASSEGEKK